MTPPRPLVLIVDDNPTNLNLAAATLAAEPYDLALAANAAEARRAIALRKPDLVLLDLGMPGVDGYALARQWRADPATRSLRLVAVTAYAMRGDEEKARAAGCDGYLTKPIDTRSFGRQVAVFLATPGASPSSEGGNP